MEIRLASRSPGLPVSTSTDSPAGVTNDTAQLCAPLVIPVPLAAATLGAFAGAAPGPPAPRTTQQLSNDEMSPLFEAVIEATEEAIYNSMFMATTVTGRGRTVPAIPLDSVRAVLRKYGIAPKR